jgi:hypothetical protein
VCSSDLSEKNGNPKHYLLKQSDKTFLKMNRSLWKEIKDLIQIQRRVAFRTRHLLRIIIYYLFEVRKIERKFWKKYIPSVEKIIHYAFKEKKEQLQGVSRALARQITEYRDTQEYRGTDWNGFYKDAKSRSLAREILKETVEKSRSRQDRKLPAIWFSNQVEKGVDYLVLFRFFRKGVKEI